MFVKFDENGKMVSFNLADRREDILPDAEGFEPIDGDVTMQDAFYLVKRNGVIMIDEEAKAAAEAEREKRHRIHEIKSILQELDYDIQACEDGQVKTKTLAEYRAERAELRNELRELQGKSPLPSETVI